MFSLKQLCNRGTIIPFPVSTSVPVPDHFKVQFRHNLNKNYLQLVLMRKVYFAGLNPREISMSGLYVCCYGSLVVLVMSMNARQMTHFIIPRTGRYLALVSLLPSSRPARYQLYQSTTLSPHSLQSW